MICAFEVSRVIFVVGGIRECESEVRAVLGQRDSLYPLDTAGL